MESDKEQVIPVIKEELPDNQTTMCSAERIDTFYNSSHQRMMAGCRKETVVIKAVIYESNSVAAPEPILKIDQLDLSLAINCPDEKPTECDDTSAIGLDDESSCNSTLSLCEICGKTFTSPQSARDHMANHVKLDGQSKQTPKIDKGECKKFVPYHINRNTEENRHPCRQCGRFFSNSSAFSRHLKIHTGDKPHKCNTCAKSFHWLSDLRRHLKIHSKEKPHVCMKCGKSFSQLSSLNRHGRIHTGKKPYICEDCGMSFNDSSNLRIHLESHSGEKSHKCGVCGKSFSQLRILHRHGRIHTGEKPYMCKECGNSFSQSSNLNHLKIHSGQKRHKCEVCGKSFMKASDIRRHERIHTGEKPYMCKECGKSFNQSSSLSRHLMIHSGKKTHSPQEKFLNKALKLEPPDDKLDELEIFNASTFSHNVSNIPLIKEEADEDSPEILKYINDDNNCET